MEFFIIGIDLVARRRCFFRIRPVENLAILSHDFLFFIKRNKKKFLAQNRFYFIKKEV